MVVYCRRERSVLADGTLTPIVKVPSAALPSKSLLKSLAALCADPKNVVYIISGRNGDFLEEHLGHIPNLGMSAEHGCFIRAPQAKDWISLTDDLNMDWKKDVLQIFRCESRVWGPGAAPETDDRFLRRLRGAHAGILRREEGQQRHVPLPQRRPRLRSVPRCVRSEKLIQRFAANAFPLSQPRSARRCSRACRRVCRSMSWSYVRVSRANWWTKTDDVDGNRGRRTSKCVPPTRTRARSSSGCSTSTPRPSSACALVTTRRTRTWCGSPSSSVLENAN